MRRVVLFLAAALVVSTGADSLKAATIFSSSVSTWTSGSPVGPGLIPIGGAGQVNGNFVVTSDLGLEIGLRGAASLSARRRSAAEHRRRHQGNLFRPDWNVSPARGRCHLELRHSHRSAWSNGSRRGNGPRRLRSAVEHRHHAGSGCSRFESALRTSRRRLAVPDVAESVLRQPDVQMRW